MISLFHHHCSTASTSSPPVSHPWCLTPCLASLLSLSRWPVMRSSLRERQPCEIREDPMIPPLRNCLCLTMFTCFWKQMGNSSSDRSGSQGERSDREQGGKEAQEIQEFLAWQHDLESDSKSPTQARPTVFRWTGAAKEVFVSGSFNNWATKIPLNKSQKNFVGIVDLPEGEHQYKFSVDGQWTLDPTGAVTTSKTGTVNNVIQVKTTDFEVFDALRIDSEDTEDISDLSSSPPGPYLQEAYVIKPEDKIKHPPILPPHLLQVLLNKDTSISDGVMVLSATHRYKKKYVTTLLYKPI
ncbi:hypothetical protein F7725_012771 [Dissostichus mawsoni]|uniref:Association with the SNF1 complex (ASC) domain-containing protein n=1 Tax=Dissostichus mawsoni TaxID=36200 RepID=A0A7J5YQI4_DISMA|nr:hypothetical protein F7725_012771 [Dissostichus mawsoni]